MKQPTNPVVGEKKLTKEERERAHRNKKKKEQKLKKKSQKELEGADDQGSETESQVSHTEGTSASESSMISESFGSSAAAAGMTTADSEQDTNDVEYIYENEDTVLTGQYYEIFKDVFKKYTEKQKQAVSGEVESSNAADGSLKEGNEEKSRADQEFEEKKAKRAQEKLEREINKDKLSRKQRKQQRWLQVAQLKALVKRPDLVEAWDITAQDPKMLIFLKSLKNTVPVPRHWSQKRKYLQNKRGVLKEPFRLPDYIENTGIARLRDPFSERDGSVMVKQKLKDRMNPKMGKIEIDYDVLHDAFFKFQTKTKLSIHGDVYYEGKEDECQHKKYKPGRMSEALRQALEISDFASPPWLTSMQRFGPPPSYPNLRILGMNYHEQGGLNFVNRTAIEDQIKQQQVPGVYGTFRSSDYSNEDMMSIPKTYWGQVIEDDDGNLDEQDEIEPEKDDNDDDDLGDDDVDFEEQLQQGAGQGYGGNSEQHKQGTSSVSGYETPEVDLRNQATSAAPLYHVMEQVSNKQATAGSLLGTQHSYVMHGHQQN